MNPTDEIIEAVEHVRDYFPEVNFMIVTGDGRHTFLTDNFEAPSFEGSGVDMSIVEKGAKSVDGPFIFEYEAWE